MAGAFEISEVLSPFRPSAWGGGTEARLPRAMPRPPPRPQALLRQQLTFAQQVSGRCSYSPSTQVAFTAAPPRRLSTPSSPGFRNLPRQPSQWKLGLELAPALWPSQGELAGCVPPGSCFLGTETGHVAPSLMGTPLDPISCQHRSAPTDRPSSSSGLAKPLRSDRNQKASVSARRSALTSCPSHTPQVRLYLSPQSPQFRALLPAPTPGLLLPLSRGPDYRGCHKATRSLCVGLGS